jgi:Fe-S oxidoreductase
MVAMVRRSLFKPERYAVPPKYGKDHSAEAVFVLLMICGLMISDGLFESSLSAAQIQKDFPIDVLIPGTLRAIFTRILSGVTIESLQAVHLASYLAHELIFFSFLCFLPFGKHFHVITAFLNVFFLKLDKGTVKPVLWNVDEAQIEQLDSIGVKKYEDFTWKHMLDFYSCADCGRCSDHCPANAVGRPLSPRFISIKCRDYSFNKYPIFGGAAPDRSLIGDVLEEDEIWSCTTCGACEEECPLLIEYIDKIVDLRRGMVDEGQVPQSLQKPLGALEKRGNPYGKMEKKRADWSKEMAMVKILGKREKADTLYFVDSITSYDDRIQEIAKASARVLHGADVDFGILGRAEKDSGHEVKRFGEEILFFELRDQNIEAILNTGVKQIVTADPHAFNALKKDYKGLPTVLHLSQVIDQNIISGKIRLNPIEPADAVFTYHDPCYLGRHNSIYDAPRRVLDAIPGMRRVEMDRCRDRSFCCGGGGLMLFYEPVEETRMGKLRVSMAKETGANTIVTACPFCLVNIEDAIKTSGLEGNMQVIDLVELVDQQMIAEK